MPTKEEYLAAADLADRAAKRLERGWCQKAVARDGKGIARDASDSCSVAWCAYGALMAEAPNVPCGTQLVMEAKCAFENITSPNTAIGMWNDLPDRTQAEVVQAMKDTAKELRKKAEECVN